MTRTIFSTGSTSLCKKGDHETEIIETMTSTCRPSSGLSSPICVKGFDQNLANRPWASVLRLITRNALASGSARPMIDAA
jgi:hypothetical protein